MKTQRFVRLACVFAIAGSLGPAIVVAQSPVPPPVAPQDLSRAMAVEEDARLTGDANIASILRGLRGSDDALRAQAVRALGRFENQRFLPMLEGQLAASSPRVRVEAAQAVTQTLMTFPRADTALFNLTMNRVRAALIERVRIEQDPSALAAAAWSLGRMVHPAPAALAVESALTPLLSRTDTTVLLGALHGLEELVRSSRAAGLPTAPVAAVLARIAQNSSLPAGARRLAFISDSASNRLDLAVLRAATRDPDGGMRRLAAVATANLATLDGRDSLLGRFLVDPEMIVRLEAVRGWARRFQTTSCRELLIATRDSAAPVAIAAIDALSSAAGRGGPRACPDAERAQVEMRLRELIERAEARAGVAVREPAGRADAHKGAHALVTLASMNPTAVRESSQRLAMHQMWQVRVYATRAAAAISDSAVLARRARDVDPNVREAAIDGLLRVRGHAADSIYIAALTAKEYQVILAAVRGLNMTPNRDAAVPALVASLARISAERKETSRDPRVAIINRLAQLGATEPLRAYLGDFETGVARAAAAALRVDAPAPVKSPPADLPLDLAAVRNTRVRFTMSADAGGGSFELALNPEVAQFTVARFLRLARAGYYNGLTFHRIAANFVVQGGSPAATEYVGDGPYMRDEIALLSHDRGTLGISTRGRDLGDAQIFINTIDNPRLDFDYTVFARVVSGMSVVDGMLEGDVIARVEVIAR